MIKLFNTMSRKIEAFKPLEDNSVKIYTCGPTVYDYPHIGNWFTFIRFDLLVRMLQAKGYQTKWAMNMTDVGHLVSDQDEGQDKLEKGAQREGKTAWQIADFYSKNFVKDLRRLNFLMPDFLPKATEHISEQIQLIQKLEQMGLTYKIKDGIYFDTSKLSDYGKLARLDIKNLKAGARIEYNPEKRNITDFALWKISQPDIKRDMEWDSPWGKGFPGWHLECSAMSMKYLGETLDIHGGAIDLIPVHHTNEIAQSESATHKNFARYWFHTNHIIIDGTKMSKSLGNSITLDDILAKGYDLESLRLLVIESHYRSQAVFSWDTLTAAQNRLNSLRAMASLKWQTNPNAEPTSAQQFKDNYNQILDVVSDDLNTSLGLSNLNAFADQLLESTLAESNLNDFNEYLQKIDKLLGLTLSKTKDIEPAQKALIEERETARQVGDWSKSDKIRQELKEQGIEVRDTAFGPIWNYFYEKN